MSKFGLVVRPEKVRDYDFFAVYGATTKEETALPEKYILPIDTYCKVKDQGDVGACVSYGMTTVMEYHYNTTNEGEISNWSEGHFYGHPVNREGYYDEGLIMSMAAKGALKIGFLPERYFDIIEEVPEITKAVKSRPDLDQYSKPYAPSAYVVVRNYALESKKEEAIKRAIMEYGPIAIGSKKYFRGGAHCIVLYGWDDTDRKKNESANFLFRNSWGSSYKNGGNWNIPTDYIDEGYAFIWDDVKLPFTDVKETDWFYKEVKNAVFSGLFKGISDTEFAPEGCLIRGDMAITIDRLIERSIDSVNTYIKTLNQKGIKTNEIKRPNASIAEFNDVDKADYYYDAVHAVSLVGIMNGIGDGKFCPKDNITRAEVAAIVYRAYMYIYKLIKSAIPSADIVLMQPDPSTIQFDDVCKADWYYDEVRNTVAAGLMQGVDDNLFEPERNINRAESATVLNRLFEGIDYILDII